MESLEFRGVGQCITSTSPPRSRNELIKHLLCNLLNKVYHGLNFWSLAFAPFAPPPSFVLSFGVSDTGCLLNIVFFPLNVMIFPNSASLVAALVCYLPSSGPSIKSGFHTLTPLENRARPESEIYLKIFEKTQYLMNTQYYHNC